MSRLPELELVNSPDQKEENKTQNDNQHWQGECVGPKFPFDWLLNFTALDAV